jgi:molybdopterin converting factor small subunit
MSVSSSGNNSNSGNQVQSQPQQQQQQAAKDDFDASVAGLYEDENAVATDATPTGDIADPVAEGNDDDQPAQQQDGNDGKGGHDFNKGLSKTQQEVSTLKSTVESLAGTVQTLVDRLTQQAASGNAPTAQQARQVQQAQAQEQVDDLADALKDIDDVEFVEAKHVRKLLEKVNGLHRDLTDLKQARQSASQVDEYWSKWDQDHPTVSAQRKDLIQSAADWVSQKYPIATADQKAAYLTARFDMLVEQAESQAAASKPAAGAKPAAVPQTPRKTVPGPTAGTRITHPGASQSAAAQNEPASFEDEIRGLYDPNG